MPWNKSEYVNKRKDDEKDPFVSIFILNYNNKEDTIECIEAVKRIQYKNVDVTLVQNGSSEELCLYFSEKYTDMHHVILKENRGFTGGFNRGIKEIMKREHESDYILFVSNDVVVESDIIEKMLSSSIEEDHRIICPAVLYYKNHEKLWCAGGNYNWLLGKNRMRGTDSFYAGIYKENKRVDWASFCIVMIKTSVFKQIGYLDEEFFLSNEDLDFCLRAQKQGIFTYYCGNAKAYHKIAVDLGGIHNPLYIYYQVRNTLLCHKKNLKKYHFTFSMLNYLLISVTRRILRLTFAGEFYKAKYIFMGIYDFFLGNFEEGVLSKKIKDKLFKNKRFKIGINARYLQRQKSGIERYIEELIIHLASIDSETEYFLFFTDSNPVPSLQLPQNFNIVVSSFPGKKAWLRLFWEQLILGYELKKYNINLFHGPAFFVPFWKPKNCKYVLTVHDVTFIKYPEAFTKLTQFYYKLLFTHSLKIADCIIADSTSTKNDLMKHYGTPEKKIKVVYLGVGDMFLKEKILIEEKDIKEKYGLQDKYLLFTGVLSPRKNVERIIDAFSTLKQDDAYKDYCLLIIGRKGWLYQDLFDKIEKTPNKGDIKIIDYVSDRELSIIYALATIFIFPSLYEGFGLPILEAMAGSCPVITSNVSSMPEVAGDAAILINPYSVDELVAGIKQITTNSMLREELQRKGLLQVKKFSWGQTAVETNNIYKQQMKEVIR